MKIAEESGTRLYVHSGCTKEEFSTIEDQSVREHIEAVSFTKGDSIYETIDCSLSGQQMTLMQDMDPKRESDILSELRRINWRMPWVNGERE